MHSIANSNGRRRNGRRRAKGFTLIEVMLVVVLMAIIAALAIPSAVNSTNEARLNTALFNLSSLRSQIQRYRAEHGGALPTQTLIELLSQSDSTGAIGTGANFRYGPYLLTVPANPFNESAVVAAAGTNPPTATVSGAGWLYDTSSGNMWLNDTSVPFVSQ